MRSPFDLDLGLVLFNRYWGIYLSEFPYDQQNP